MPTIIVGQKIIEWQPQGNSALVTLPEGFSPSAEELQSISVKIGRPVLIRTRSSGSRVTTATFGPIQRASSPIPATGSSISSGNSTGSPTPAITTTNMTAVTAHPDPAGAGLTEPQKKVLLEFVARWQDINFRNQISAGLCVSSFLKEHDIRPVMKMPGPISFINRESEWFALLAAEGIYRGDEESRSTEAFTSEKQGASVRHIYVQEKFYTWPTLVHETIHALCHPLIHPYFSDTINESMTEYFTRIAIRCPFRLALDGESPYKAQTDFFERYVKFKGFTLKQLTDLYFAGDQTLCVSIRTDHRDSQVVHQAAEPTENLRSSTAL